MLHLQMNQVKNNDEFRLDDTISKDSAVIFSQIVSEGCETNPYWVFCKK